MKKPKTLYVCQHCDAQYPKWVGQCLECGKWSTVVPQVVDASAPAVVATPAADVVALGKDAVSENVQRRSTGFNEVDRVFGGGIVPGSMIVLGGEPGVGKSTLALQIAASFSASVLYVSGEESANQVQQRFARLTPASSTSRAVGFVGTQHLETLLSTIEKEQPSLVVIDSIQMLQTDQVEGEAGSVSQIRACAARLMEYAKSSQTSMLLIGHVTKDGSLGGPKTLEHLVDVVLYLEGDRRQLFRILRSVKNRFGSISEVGIFDLTAAGFVGVPNPSAHFFQQTEHRVSGSALTVLMEGSRPLLLELQALVSKTAFGYPVRKSSGVELNRLQLLTAVVTQRAGIPLQASDIYMNTVGDLSVTERVADLTICCAIASAFSDQVIPNRTVILGEVGLSGEIRPVPRLEDRLREAEQLQMTSAVIPSGNKLPSTKLKLHPVQHLREAFKTLHLVGKNF